MEIPKRILTQDPKDKTASQRSADADFELAKKNYRATESKFSRYFSITIGGEQITAALKLANALEIVSTAGNATPAYDGVSITSASFGPKDGVTDRVLYASDDIRRCRAVLAEVLTPYNLFQALEDALTSDMEPQKLGDLLAKQYRLNFGREKRRELAINVIDTATAAIVPIFNSKRG